MDELKLNLRIRWVIALIGGSITTASVIAYW
jgi:hypothetical protein